MARVRATSSGEREALRVLCELAPMPFIQYLTSPLHNPVLDTDSLFKAIRIFERVTTTRCIKREFILLRHEDAVIGVDSLHPLGQPLMTVASGPALTISRSRRHSGQSGAGWADQKERSALLQRQADPKMRSI